MFQPIPWYYFRQTPTNIEGNLYAFLFFSKPLEMLKIMTCLLCATHISFLLYQIETMEQSEKDFPHLLASSHFSGSQFVVRVPSLVRYDTDNIVTLSCSKLYSIINIVQLRNYVIVFTGLFNMFKGFKMTLFNASIKISNLKK